MTDSLEGARGLGIELDAAQCAKLIPHLDLLDDWNTRMNLTAIRERPAQITKHILDSLTLVPWLRGKRVADIGSGAGFPGIPLAIALPGVHFALVESVGKKCRFLEYVRETLALDNVEVVQSRAEAYRPRSASTRSSRAPSARWELVKNAGGLVAGGGRLLAMKGRFPDGRAREKAQRLEGRGRPPAARARPRGGTSPRRVRPLPRKA